MSVKKRIALLVAGALAKWLWRKVAAKRWR